MTDAKRELDKIREALERADAQLVEALEARAKAVKGYAALKQREPDAYLALTSSAEIVRRALENARSFPPAALESVLREILGACAAMVAPVQVAVLGPEGGLGSAAARLHFGSSAATTVHDSVAAIFDEIARGRSSYGVVPFETSTDGAVGETLDALVQSEARICGERTVANTYALVSRTGNAADVEKIYATSTALAACERTVRREFPRAALLDVRSGRVAADLAGEDHGAAAIVVGAALSDGSELRVVRERLEERLGVETRFAIVGGERPARTGTDRTILALAVHDAPGSLHKVLSPLADRGVNLTRIESRPARGAAWRYHFLLELEGHITDRNVVTAIEEVRGQARFLKVLGSYPQPS